MARDQVIVTCPPGEWTQLTNADATTITFQVITGSVKVRATTGGTAPSSLSDGGAEYHSDAVFVRNGELRISISDLASAAGMVRLWATPLDGKRCRLYVDHA